MAENKSTPAAKAPAPSKIVGQGEVVNTSNGTNQSEPTPEELPADAKIAPRLEQIAPNQASLAVGALPTPDEIAGAPQPAEGEKLLTSDTSSAAAFLPENSEQVAEAKRAEERAKINAAESTKTRTTNV